VGDGRAKLERGVAQRISLRCGNRRPRSLHAISKRQQDVGDHELVPKTAGSRSIVGCGPARSRLGFGLRGQARTRAASTVVRASSAEQARQASRDGAACLGRLAGAAGTAMQAANKNCFRAVTHAIEHFEGVKGCMHPWHCSYAIETDTCKRSPMKAVCALWRTME